MTAARRCPRTLFSPATGLTTKQAEARSSKGPTAKPRLGSGGDPYAVLGVSRNADLREIRAAYVRLVKDLHPDAHAYDPLADERLKAINNAYQDLKDLHRLSASPNTRSGSFARRSAVFAASFLTSVATVLAIVGGLYGAGLLGPEPAAPSAPLQQPARASHKR